MPTPRPNDETRDEWMERCIPVLIDEGREQDEAVAICSSMWERAKDDGEMIDTDDVDIELDDELRYSPGNIKNGDDIIEIDLDLLTPK